MNRYKTHLYSPTAFPTSFPYSRTDLAAYDTEPDSVFYQPSRFVNHIDDHAIQALEEYYDHNLSSSSSSASTSQPQGQAQSKVKHNPKILDLCSSWVSHIPAKGDREIFGLGMNSSELSSNPILSKWVVHDLNQSPDFREALIHGEPGRFSAGVGVDGESAKVLNRFHAVICNVSIDYLTSPLDVMRTIWEVLEEGGYAYMAISNRCFPNKVVRPWLNLSTDGKLGLVASYFHFAGTSYGKESDEAREGGVGRAVKPGDLFDEIEQIELVGRGSAWDPLWIIRAKAKTCPQS